MEFQKYPSLKQHYKLKQETIDQYKDTEFYVYEKLDGANIHIAISKIGEVRLASRNRYISDEFFGVGEVLKMHEAAIDSAIKFATTNCVDVRLYGELYGQGIQNRIHYGAKNFRIFDIKIDDVFLHQTPYLTPQLLAITMQPIAKVQSLEAALQCRYIGERKSEGVVIKEAHTTLNKSKLGYIKVVNEEFKERKSKPFKVADSAEIKELKQAIDGYVNSNRLYNIISKDGDIQSKKEIGRYVKLLMEDAIADFVEDYPIFQEFSKNEQKKITKDAQKTAQKLIYNELNI